MPWAMLKRGSLTLTTVALFGLFQDAQGITYDSPPMSSPVDN